MKKFKGIFGILVMITESSVRDTLIGWTGLQVYATVSTGTFDVKIGKNTQKGTRMEFQSLKRI